MNIDYEVEVSKNLSGFRLKNLQASGLSFERIYLDGYQDGKDGWEVPMKEPFTSEILFKRTRLDSPLQGGPKYIQPTGTGLVPFYPYLENWAEIAQDPSIEIIFTEGEKKASKLVQEGFIAISMPGVNAYGSKRFIESISNFNWFMRKTYLCFDSDIKIKRPVRNALDSFAKVLHRKGALVLEIELPDITNEKGDK